ncbi:MAG: hypothetical protein QM784_21400 [Polyangiaceae bacterium]
MTKEASTVFGKNEELSERDADRIQRVDAGSNNADPSSETGARHDDVRTEQGEADVVLGPSHAEGSGRDLHSTPPSGAPIAAERRTQGTTIMDFPAPAPAPARTPTPKRFSEHFASRGTLVLPPSVDASHAAEVSSASSAGEISSAGEGATRGRLGVPAEPTKQSGATGVFVMSPPPSVTSASAEPTKQSGGTGVFVMSPPPSVTSASAEPTKQSGATGVFVMSPPSVTSASAEPTSVAVSGEPLTPLPQSTFSEGSAERSGERPRGAALPGGDTRRWTAGKTLILAAKSDMAKDADEKSGESATHAGESATHAGESATHAGESATHAGESATHAGESATHAGESATHAGESATHAGALASEQANGAEASSVEAGASIRSDVTDGRDRTRIVAPEEWLPAPHRDCAPHLCHDAPTNLGESAPTQGEGAELDGKGGTLVVNADHLARGTHTVPVGEGDSGGAEKSQLPTATVDAAKENGKAAYYRWFASWKNPTDSISTLRARFLELPLSRRISNRTRSSRTPRVRQHVLGQRAVPLANGSECATCAEAGGFGAQSRRFGARNAERTERRCNVGDGLAIRKSAVTEDSRAPSRRRHRRGQLCGCTRDLPDSRRQRSRQ